MQNNQQKVTGYNLKSISQFCAASEQLCAFHFKIILIWLIYSAIPYSNASYENCTYSVRPYNITYYYFFLHENRTYQHESTGTVL